MKHDLGIPTDFMLLGTVFGATEGFFLNLVQVGWVASVIGLVIGAALGFFVGTLSVPLGFYCVDKKDKGRVTVILWSVSLSSVAGAILFINQLRVPLFSSEFLLVMFSPVAVCWMSMVMMKFWLPDIVTNAGQCRHCAYDLRGSLSTNRCPECGKEFNPDEVRKAYGPNAHPDDLTH